jgi:hypothetical protein
MGQRLDNGGLARFDALAASHVGDDGVVQDPTAPTARGVVW